MSSAFRVDVPLLQLVVVILGVLFLAGDTFRVVDAIKHHQEEGQAVTAATVGEAGSGLRRALLSRREELLAGAGGSCKGVYKWRKNNKNEYTPCNANSKCVKTERDGCACDNGYYNTNRTGNLRFPVCEKCPAGEYAVWSHSKYRDNQNSCTKCPSGCTSAPGGDACYSASASYLSSLELFYAISNDWFSMEYGSIEAYTFTYSNGTTQLFGSCNDCTKSKKIEFDSANPPIMIEAPFDYGRQGNKKLCYDSVCIGNGDGRRQFKITFADKSQTEYGSTPGNNKSGYRLCKAFDKSTRTLSTYQMGSTKNGPITYLTNSRTGSGCNEWPDGPPSGAGGPGWCT